MTDGALYRTKIHCYFLDQTRVIKPLPNEKNYHIFYQMLAGLSQEERARLNLEGYSPKNLRYLQNGDTRQDETEDAARFQAWKACLGMLNFFFIFTTTRWKEKQNFFIPTQVFWEYHFLMSCEY